MITNIAKSFRIYPNNEQEKELSEYFGCTRFLWNLMLEDKINHYKKYNKAYYPKPASYKSKYSFLKRVDSLALCNVQLNLEKAYKNFFRSGFGKPKFKSKKDSRKSYTTNNVNNSIRIEGDYIRLPKIGMIKAKIHDQLEEGDIIKRATVSKEPDGKYYVSLCCESYKDRTLLKLDTSIGLDLGIQNLYTDSNGNKVPNPKFQKKSLPRIRILQKSLSRKKKGSKNYEKAREKLAKENTRVKNRRKDYANKVSKKVINENQVICLESLSVNEICNSKKSSKNFRRAAYDAGLGMFISMLVYKAKLYGRTIKTVDKYFKSSQICSSCGSLHPEMKNHGNKKLVCKDCGTILDRDWNAAINILKNAK